MVDAISAAIEDYRHRIKEGQRFYSQELVDNLFFHPYTKIEFVERDLGVSRLTATKYLDALADAGFVKKEKAGRFNFYINTRLVDILVDSRSR
jgi:Fic family protein